MNDGGTNAYIHVPFCRGKCAYCAFYSEPSRSDEAVRDYLKKLSADLAPHQGTPLKTLYLGGGTPTLLNCGELEILFSLLRRTFLFSPDAEISMECNPETMTREKARLISSFVNRISMGVQSFRKENLRVIGRTSPDAEKAFSCAEMLQDAGIRNLGADLICAIPGEGIGDFESDLGKALSLGITHLSCYSLTLEEGSVLAGRANVPEVSDDFSDACWSFAGEYLAERGFARYEVSNYARKNFECRHNQNVWHGEKYLAFGPGACSFDGRIRRSNVKPLSRWLAGEEAEKDEIGPEARAREIFVMGLRTVRGWEKKEFSGVSGFPCSFPEIPGLIREGLLSDNGTRIFPTENGLRFWDTLAEELIQNPGSPSRESASPQR